MYVTVWAAGVSESGSKSTGIEIGTAVVSFNVFVFVITCTMEIDPAQLSVAVKSSVYAPAQAVGGPTLTYCVPLGQLVNAGFCASLIFTVNVQKPGLFAASRAVYVKI